MLAIKLFLSFHTQVVKKKKNCDKSKTSVCSAQPQIDEVEKQIDVCLDNLGKHHGGV